MCNDEHALLALAQKDLVRCHSFLANGHLRDVDRNAGITALSHFCGGRGESGRPHVLDGDDVSALDELEARLEQQLFGKWVTDLNARTFCLARFREVLRRERCAVDSVASRSS